MKSVLKMAYEVIDMQNEILQLRHEVARLSQIEIEYKELLNSSIEHSNVMMGNLLGVILDKPEMFHNRENL